MITVAIEAASAVPVFEQLRSQIEVAIRTGALEAGQSLPTIRQLAADLAIAPNTVGRAYKELERSGLIRTGRRRGTMVADLHDDPILERRARLADAAERYAAEASRIGATLDEAIEALRTRATSTRASPRVAAPRAITQ
jgi:DNA-binding transcriptional regulator YhcF (GntR family)